MADRIAMRDRPRGGALEVAFAESILVVREPWNTMRDHFADPWLRWSDGVHPCPPWFSRLRRAASEVSP